jgi:hypothetical protein
VGAAIRRNRERRIPRRNAQARQADLIEMAEFDLDVASGVNGVPRSLVNT